MDDLLARAPNLIRLPHHDSTGLRAAILGDARLYRDYVPLDGAFERPGGPPRRAASGGDRGRAAAGPAGALSWPGDGGLRNIGGLAGTRPAEAGGGYRGLRPDVNAAPP
jgi:hypothetical protein